MTQLNENTFFSFCTLSGAGTTACCLLILGGCASSAPHAQSAGIENFGNNSATGRYAGMFDEGAAFTGQGSLSQVSFAAEGEDFDPVIDPSGQFVFFASTQHAETADIYRKSVLGQTQTRMTLDTANDTMPVISPDGNWMAFASDRSGNWDIWMMPTTGGAARQLSFESDHELHPSFSANGQEIAYCRRNDHTRQWEIWSFRLDSPGTRTFVCEGLFPQWCPAQDSRTLLYQRARARGGQLFGIWTVDFTDGQAMLPTEIVAATDEAVMHPCWSPNGELISFCTTSATYTTTSDTQTSATHTFWPQNAEIWVIGADGQGRIALTSGASRDTQPCWSSDGRVYFVSNRSGNESIWSVPAAGFATNVPASAIVGAPVNP